MIYSDPNETMALIVTFATILSFAFLIAFIIIAKIRMDAEIEENRRKTERLEGKVKLIETELRIWGIRSDSPPMRTGDSK